jgi:hypothetical protein
MLARRMRWGREAGVLAAAMGTLLFNPGSLEVYCVMALMIGRMASDEQDTPLTPWIGRLLSSVGLAVGIAYLVAEKSPWVMVRFPCEPEYSARMSEVVAVTRDGRTLAFAEENARRLTQCRPQFAPSWMVRGVIDYYGARLGASDRKHQALRSLETARILDPHHGSIHELLRAVDKLPGPR